MSTVQRILDLINCSTRVQERDAAGVIRPEGVDAVVRRKALEDALKIIKDEEVKREAL